MRMKCLCRNSTADTSDGACTPVGTGNGCTLREAITAANGEDGADVINFAPALTSGGPATISLLTVLPDLSSDITIAGPGPISLLVERSHLGGTSDFRIFKVTAVKFVTISGLALANGVASGAFPGNLGGNLLNDQGTVEINNCLMIDSVAGGTLGNFSGTMTINDSTLSGNNGFATVSNAVPSGSSTTSPATLTINNTTISGNSGTGVRNIITSANAASPATVTINNSTISGNSVNSGALLESATAPAAEARPHHLATVLSPATRLATVLALSTTPGSLAAPLTQLQPQSQSTTAPSSAILRAAVLARSAG